MIESIAKRAEFVMGGGRKKPFLQRSEAVCPSLIQTAQSLSRSSSPQPPIREGSRLSSCDSKESEEKTKKRTDFDTLWRYFSHPRKSFMPVLSLFSRKDSSTKEYVKQEQKCAPLVPSIQVTPSRRLSISSPLRFTRTCSQDSLESLERTCRKELRRKLQETKEIPPMSLLPSPSSITVSPSLSDIGRSTTTPEDSTDLTRPASVCLKRSVCDVRDPPSPTKKTLYEVVGLTSYQQKLLVQCWPNMYSTGAGGQFASSIYTKLANKCPRAKQLMAKADGVAVFSNSDVDCSALHSRVTLELLDTLIRNLDSDHSKLTAYLIEVGRSHRGLKQEGLSLSVWDDLADSLMDCVCRYDVVKKHKELRRAWLALFAYIVDNLKSGQSIFRSSSSYELQDGGSPSAMSKK